MRNVWLVAQREYMEQIRGKTFKITTILLPAVFIGIAAVMILPGKFWARASIWWWLRRTRNWRSGCKRNSGG